MQPLLLLMALLLSPKAEAGSALNQRPAYLMLNKHSTEMQDRRLFSRRAREIIGGQEAKPHSRPYMAYVKITSSKNKYCGGFLVREDFVLTAAHCLGSSITVVLGAHNIKVNESTQQVILVKTPIPHPKFNTTTAENDIMLLKCGPFMCPRAVKMATTRLSLQSVDDGYVRIAVLCLQLEDEAKLNNAVSTIDLPGRRDKVKPGMVCSVAGWGRLGVNITRTGKLNEADLEIQRDEECTSLFIYYNKKLQICVGDPTKIQASFHGDSGGPFVCGNKTLAIISFGDTNGKPPVVYNRIKYLLPWIKKTMKRFKLRSSD